MLKLIKLGWTAAWQQPFLLTFLFLYRFAWGFVIYRTLQSIVVPLLHRYPGADGPPDQTTLFLAQSEFTLFKTDTSLTYVYLFLILLGIRMLLTPLLNAGIYYSLFHTELNTGYRFFKGIKSLGMSFYLLYIFRIILTLLPLYYLLPDITPMFSDSMTLMSHGKTLIGSMLGYVVYGYLLSLLFMHLQFGRTANKPYSRVFLPSMRGSFSILAVSLLLILLTGFLSGAVTAAALLDAGIWTFLLSQAYVFVRTFLSLWSVTSQHCIFERNMGY